MMHKYEASMLKDGVGNKAINELFKQAREDTIVTSDLSHLFK